MAINLKNKRILITAGPTWVPIDSVRVISNVATGETGILLAREAQKAAAKVTLILGPVNDCCLNRDFEVLRFRFFDELKRILIQQLRLKKYDVLIHSAAVADYRPQKVFKYKLDSRQKRIRLNLVATPKLVNSIKKIDPAILAVAFKFETRCGISKLIASAARLLRKADMDLIVANTIDNGGYRAYILDKHGSTGPILSKSKLAKKLIRQISQR